MQSHTYFIYTWIFCVTRHVCKCRGRWLRSPLFREHMTGSLIVRKLFCARSSSKCQSGAGADATTAGYTPELFTIDKNRMPITGFLFIGYQYSFSRCSRIINNKLLKVRYFLFVKKSIFIIYQCTSRFII